MVSGKLVEWELVDYGSGVFHVASYHDQRGVAVVPVSPAAAVEESAPQAHAAQTPECFFYRCWSALRDGCRAA